MAVQIRSKRKKHFKSNEGMQIDDPARRRIEKDDEPNLNVRRSSRKPKPKKLSDEFQEDIPIGIKIKEEPLDDDEDSYNTPTVYMSETPVFDTGEEPIVNANAARRETRKSFQTYLETLGYNRDFSKIAASEQHSETWQGSGKTLRLGKKAMMSYKTERNENVTQSWTLSDVESEQTHAPHKIRVSSRTPKPKKTFMLLGEEKKQSSSRSGFDHVEPTDMHLNVETKASKKLQNRKPPCGNEKNKASERCRSNPISITQPTSTPLGKNDVDESAEVMSDETDGTPSRISGRVRVPKRQFSLLEVEPASDAKRQKVVNSPEVKKGKQKDPLNQSVISSNNKATGQSSLVVKRSNKKKQLQVKNQKKQNGNTLDSCPGKVKKIIEDIHIKREVDTAESSQSETEKKTVVKKGRERIEKIVETLRLAKQSDLVSTQQEKPEEKTSTQKKGVKRKRESNEGTKKSGKASGGKKAKKNNDQSKPIVLKLCIPHGKNKDKTKKVDEKPHHKHHHHHRHKKTKQSETLIKKGKNKLKAAVKNSKKVKTNVAGKKTVKKKRLNIKQEKADDETHPHVKLIIKKSPSKTEKIAEVMMEDVPAEFSEIPVEAEEGGNSSGNKPDVKKKTPTKRYKPLTVKPLIPARPLKKKKDKTMKSRTVSAYSLFTKNRRKGLLEKEPDLDFATTSRRLAEMWKNLPNADQEYWKAKARAVRMPNGRDPTRSFIRSRRGVYDSYNWSHFSDVPPSSTGTEAIDMAAYLKLLGESLCSIGMCLKRQDQMEVHGSLSVLLDTALCSIVPIFCLTSQLPEMAGCSPETQITDGKNRIKAQMLDNLAYIIPGL